MLEEQREKIDRIDYEIVQLMEERMATVLEIGRIKKEAHLSILDSGREAVVLEKIEGYVQEETYKPAIRETYQYIMDVSKKYQERVGKGE